MACNILSGCAAETPVGNVDGCPCFFIEILGDTTGNSIVRHVRANGLHDGIAQRDEADRIRADRLARLVLPIPRER